MGVGNRQRLQYGKTLTEGLEPLDVNEKRKKSGRILEIGKRILIAAGILIASFVLCLCVMAVIKVCNKSRSRDKIYVQQDALEYLEKRYGEEFIVIYNRGMGYAYNYVQLYAYPKGYSDEKHKFEIQGYYNKWGKLDYYDSYVMVKLTDEYEAYVSEIIDEYFDDYKFFLEFHSEWLTNNLPPDTRLEDLWELKANVEYPLPDLDIFLKSSQNNLFTKDNIMDLSYELARHGFRGSLVITCYSDDKYYEQKNNENKQECSAGEANNSSWHVLFVYDEKNIDYR